ncbi:MAG: co-chaperone GroES [Fimbriimonadaceae bacterium]
MTNLKPLGDKIVVKLNEEEEKSAGGILLPDAAKKKPQTGKVISVGSGRVLDNGDRNAMNVKAGDTVLFSKYGGNEVSVDGQDFMILDEDQIYAVIG